MGAFAMMQWLLPVALIVIIAVLLIARSRQKG